jgi:hypothetical protein
LVNGVAGGGSLLSFPALLVVGYPALTANVTSTVGIWPGYLGGVIGFRRELKGQGERVHALAGTAIAGALIGAGILLLTPDRDFAAVAPYLILFACGLFAIQPLLTRRFRRQAPEGGTVHRGALHVGTFLAAAYGAYFGAGLGVVLLAVLGVTLHDRLVRLNGLRTVLALLVNTVAMAVFVARAPVAWSAVACLVPASFIGGLVGARLSRKLPAPAVRVLVIALGLAAGVKLLLG